MTDRSNLDRFIPTELTELDTPASRMAADLLEALIDELSTMSKTWNQLSKLQQDGVIEKVRARVRELTEEALETLVGGRYQYAAVELESVTIKKGTKATVVLDRGKHAAIDYVGKKAVLVMYDPEQYFRELEDLEGEDQQKGLDLGDPPDDEDDDTDPDGPGDDDGDPPGEPPAPGAGGDDTLPNTAERVG